MSALDWRELSEALDNVLEAGGTVPCREGDLGQTQVWISSEPAHQRVAAMHCRDCSALGMCREYAVANPLEAGVLGGLTELDRKPKKISNNPQGGGRREHHEA